MSYMQKTLKRFFKVWGVGFETNMPPEFVITNHAEERMKQRMSVSERKLKQTVIKAFYSKEVSCPKMNRKEYRTKMFHGKRRIARELMGYTFIFCYSSPRSPLPTQKILITVI